MNTTAGSNVTSSFHVLVQLRKHVEPNDICAFGFHEDEPINTVFFSIQCKTNAIRHLGE